MLGILYILISILLGMIICELVFPSMNKLWRYNYSKKDIEISPIMVSLPIWYISGTLLLTWFVYILSYLFRFIDNGMLYSDGIGFLCVIFLAFIVMKSKKRNIFLYLEDKGYFKLMKMEVIYIVLVFIIAYFLFNFTFYKDNNTLYVGASVYSDFSPHIGMIRSFSKGNNFPTQYSHYGGVDIRYHFMFHFLVGNLEFLGMDLNDAFNIPSILSFVFALMLLYVLAVRITGKKSVGYLSGLFFLFRSSNSLYTFLVNIPKGEVWNTLKSNVEFIGYTPSENWGLWNLNVYANQRHFSFTIAVLLIVIIIMLPKVYSMYDELTSLESIEGIRISQFNLFFLKREAWVIKDYRKVISLGILLGAIAFWNGAVLIATIILLFFMAILSKNRLEYLVIAIIATSLSLLQSKFFIKGSAVSPTFLYGFIAENKSVFGTIDYVYRLYGILMILLAVIFVIEKGMKRILIFIFSTPFIISFFLSLTVDVTVNHKYMMLSVILLNVLVADSLIICFRKNGILVRSGCILVTLMLTATGIYDFYTYFNRNHHYPSVNLRLDDPLTQWIIDNTDSKDLFLTSNYSLNQVVLAGTMLYYGWPYYAWSAGYDTQTRMEEVKLMYESSTSYELQLLVNRNKIDYIIIDYDNRVSEDYVLNENIIRNTYELVYEDGYGSTLRSVYRTSKDMNNTKER